jgi:hypothetical protein
VQPRHLLAAVSAAQLASSVAGMTLALQRGYNYDVGFMVGHPDCVARDSLFKGTAFSAPVTTLVTQSVATAVLFRRHSRVSAVALAVIGLLNVPGYMLERLVRQRLSASGWDKLESPLIAVEIALSALMPLCGRKT